MLSDDSGSNGWDDVADEAILKESSGSSSPCDDRESTCSEDDCDKYPSKPSSWWACLLWQHSLAVLGDIPFIENKNKDKTLRIVSGCTGSFAEGEVLKAGFLPKLPIRFSFVKAVSFYQFVTKTLSIPSTQINRLSY